MTTTDVAVGPIPTVCERAQHPTERSVHALHVAPLQQPTYQESWLAERVRRTLERSASIVDPGTIEDFGAELADVARGRAQVIQAGDCAERPTDCVPEVLARKVAQIHALGSMLTLRTGLPTVHVGRIAGQFAKPRSAAVETLDGVELPVFRGMIVNGAAADSRARTHDPLRLLHAHRWAARGARYLAGEQAARQPSVWTSHEALLLDYEKSQVRQYGGRRYLASTHWPWIGDRTRDPVGPHVRLLASVDNPVAVKVGPGMTSEELLALCRILDPSHHPGRLTLIARLGASRVENLLPPLVHAVRETGHPVIWLCDPLHGNTTKTARGLKTRVLTDVTAEIAGFSRVLTSHGIHLGGMHLEATPYDVRECVDTHLESDTLDDRRYSSLCDPRLNPTQAFLVAAALGS